MTPVIACILKDLIKTDEFLFAILLFKMKTKQHLQYTMLYYFKKGKNTTEIHIKMICAVCEQKVM